MCVSVHNAEPVRGQYILPQMSVKHDSYQNLWQRCHVIMDGAARAKDQGVTHEFYYHPGDVFTRSDEYKGNLIL